MAEALAIDARRVLLTSPVELQRQRRLAAHEAHALQKWAARVVYPAVSCTALEVKLASQRILSGGNGGGGDVDSAAATAAAAVAEGFALLRLSLGDYKLDRFLGGGLLSRGITEIAGESATGKTQIGLQLCLTVQLPLEHGGLDGGAVYVSTEGAFSTRRLQQILPAFQERFDFVDADMASAVFVEHALDIDDLDMLLQVRLPKLLADSNVRLVVIDSLAALFRAEFDSAQFVERSHVLAKTAAILKRLSDEYHAPIICINQVTGVPDESGGEGRPSTSGVPALGFLWSNCINTRLLLTRDEPTPPTIRRQMHVVFAQHMAPASCRSSSQQSNDKVRQAQQATDEVVEIMHQNINKVIERGDRLDDLQDKTEELQGQANQFQKGATKLKKHMWWKNMKLNILICTYTTAVQVMVVLT